MTISTVIIDETNNIVNLVSGAQVITATADELAALQAANNPSAGNPFITDSAADSLISAHNSLATAHGLTANISAALSAAANPSASNPYLLRYVGTNAPSADNNAVAITTAWSGSSMKLAHAIRDESTFTSTASGDAYASFDAIPRMSGTISFGHLNCFQARPDYSGSGALGAAWGHTYQLNHTGAGAIDRSVGLEFLEAQGSGPINLQAALYVDATLTRATSNYVIYAGGTTPSYHGGLFQTGGDILAAGKITASNIWCNTDFNSVGVGVGIPASPDLNFYDVFIGFNAGYSLVGSNQKNTFIGVTAGYSTTAGNGGVFIGYGAGYWETADNKLFIDNAARADEATARQTALIYGVFNDTFTNQELTFNCGKMGFFATAAVAKPTGVAVSAAGIHAALVTLGLIAA